MLVLLNGMPGSGKSTLAAAWCDRAPAGVLPLALDVDVVRAMLGGWREARIEAGLAARALAIAAIGAHLGAGRDVVVPQYLVRAAFIAELEAVAARSGASFVECAILIDPERAAERLARRSAAAAGARRVEGELEGTAQHAHDELERFLALRPGTHRVPAETAAALERLDRLVDAARAG